MPSVDAKLVKVSVGDIPGPVSIECVEGETAYQVTMREELTGDIQVVQLCVPNTAAACDVDGLFTLLASAGWAIVDSGC